MLILVPTWRTQGEEDWSRSPTPARPRLVANLKIHLAPVAMGREKTRPRTRTRASHHLLGDNVTKHPEPAKNAKTCLLHHLNGTKAEVGETSSRHGVAATEATPLHQEEAGTEPCLHRQRPGVMVEAGDTTSLGLAGQRRTSLRRIDPASGSLRKMQDIVSMTSRQEKKMPTSAPSALAQHPQRSDTSKHDISVKNSSKVQRSRQAKLVVIRLRASSRNCWGQWPGL